LHNSLYNKDFAIFSKEPLKTQPGFLGVPNCFFATFIPGLQEPIAEIVHERLPDAVVHKLLDGAILFETCCSYDKLNFFCFNNIFAVVDVMEHNAIIDSLAQGEIETHIAAIIRTTLSSEADNIIAHNSKKFRTFRIVISQENKPTAIDEKLRLAAERYIAKISGLKADRSRPDTEFWFLCRSEGFSLFMKRLTLRPSWEKSLHPGELPPPLAFMLCHLANLKHSDMVLDPFCGYGSIPQAAIKYFHITQCIACDSDDKAAAYTTARFNNRPDQLTLHKADFRSLTGILPPNSVDVIVTDPPWGDYRKSGAAHFPINELYEEMFNVFSLLLRENGRIVILGARTDDTANMPLINAAKGRFLLQKQIPILLSGKKAAIFCFGRERMNGMKRSNINSYLPTG
jgi:tRNA1(Val) A37 N6-methylase TrmN6